MFRIGEFSKPTQISIRMLRYYDETGLLKPSKIDKFTNYRLYSAEQIPELNKIIFLRDLGFNVSEIRNFLNNWDEEFIKIELENKRLEIEAAIQKEHEKLAKIELAKNDIKKEKITINYNVTIKSVPSFKVLSLRRVMRDYYSEGVLWKEMFAFMEKNKIPILDGDFAIYHDLDYKENDVDIEICMPVAELRENADGFIYRNTEPIEIMACTMVYGDFKNIKGVFLSFANWLQEHNQYKMAGTSRQTVHRGPWNEEDSDKYLTEIQIPLEPLV